MLQLLIINFCYITNIILQHYFHDFLSQILLKKFAPRSFANSLSIIFLRAINCYWIFRKKRQCLLTIAIRSSKKIAQCQWGNCMYLRMRFCCENFEIFQFFAANRNRIRKKIAQCKWNEYFRCENKTNDFPLHWDKSHFQAK